MGGICGLMGEEFARCVAKTGTLVTAQALRSTAAERLLARPWQHMTHLSLNSSFRGFRIFPALLLALPAILHVAYILAAHAALPDHILSDFCSSLDITLRTEKSTSYHGAPCMGGRENKARESCQSPQKHAPLKYQISGE